MKRFLKNKISRQTFSAGPKLNIFEFESIFHEIDKCGLKLPINRHFSTQFHLLDSIFYSIFSIA
jgi:hypothetical protein